MVQQQTEEQMLAQEQTEEHRVAQEQMLEQTEGEWLQGIKERMLQQGDGLTVEQRYETLKTSIWDTIESCDTNFNRNKIKMEKLLESDYDWSQEKSDIEFKLAANFGVIFELNRILKANKLN